MRRVEIMEAENLDFQEWKLDKLCRYIVYKHHSFSYQQIRIITALTKKIVAEEGDDHPTLNKIAEIFLRMAGDTRTHMEREERILFPFIEQLVEAAEENIKISRPFFGTVNNPTQIMKIEHEEAAEDMAAIRQITNNYSIPEDASQSIINLYELLIDFEADLAIHVHLESDILFPKALRLEKEIGLS